MEEYVDKLVVITYIKDAISNTYNESDMANIYHDCMELINEVEKNLVLRLVDTKNIK